MAAVLEQSSTNFQHRDRLEEVTDDLCSLSIEMSRISLDDSLASSNATADEHQTKPLTIPAMEVRRLPMNIGRSIISRRGIMVPLLMHVISLFLLYQHCNAFPTPNAHVTSHVTSRGQTIHRTSTRLAYSIGASYQDSLRLRTECSDIKSKSIEFLKRLFRHRRQSQQCSDFGHGMNLIAKATHSLNTKQREALHRPIRIASSRVSAEHTNNDNVATKSRSRPISPIKPTNRFLRDKHASPTSAIHKMLRISKVQSLASSPTALHMVLSTPESIIEQVSTEKLLDILIDESVRTSSREPIMMQFNPRRGWIWRQWRGTVFSETWKSGLLNMALATFVVLLYKMYPNLKDLLQGFSILWGQLLSVTTFTLTFFLNQSYGLWRKCYDYSRRLQGRLNDLGMTLAAHATRVSPSSPDIPSTYTPQSKQALELVSRYVRVFNLLTYASFTRSHRPILTPRGMRRLVERGILTPKEREILIDSEIPATQRHNAVLVWLIRLFLEGMQTGIFEGGAGFEEQFMEKCHVIRAQYGAIGDELQGRMPLAYAHIVQVLLDVVLWMYPFMALSTGMAWYIGVVGTGLLTMFYQGLFDLAKQFLDPYDNENYGKGEDPLVIDTLIAETNAGSVRWLNSFQQQPWSKQLLKDGELYDSVLPLRGYSVEEIREKKAQEEAEQMEKDRLKEEKRLKEEELERQRAEDWLKENFESFVQNNSTSLVEKSNGTAILSPRAERAMSSNSMNKTLLEVSGGQVVSTSSLLPSNTYIDNTLNRAQEIIDGINSTDINEPLKLLTLDDGTLVTPDEFIVINNTESKLESVAQVDYNTVKDAAALVGIGATTNLLPSNDITYRTPMLEETITPVDIYLRSLSKTPIADDDFDPFEIEWFDEVGPDGQEMRLSQMLADEDWSDLIEDKTENRTMDYDEFKKKAHDLIEQTENEIAETKEILYSSPGSQADYDAKEKSNASSLPNQRLAVEEKIPAYDQTLLDPISQLWGAPPNVLGTTMLGEDEEEQKPINEDLDFANIYALWGQPVKPKVSTDDDLDVTSPSIDGITQLWGSDSSRAVTDPKSLAPDPRSAHSAFAGLEWWDTVSDDGKEIRLSMMLADEEYEEEIQEEQEKEPMNYEQFAMETENMIQMVEEERRETEAIMAAPPGADAPAELDESEDTSSASENMLAAVAASEEFEEMVMSLSSKTDAESEQSLYGDEVFSVLEMDVADDDTRDNVPIPSNITEKATAVVDTDQAVVTKDN